MDNKDITKTIINLYDEAFQNFNFEKVVDYCNKTLEVDKNNMDAFFYKKISEAWVAGSWDSLLDDLLKVIELLNDKSDIEKELVSENVVFFVHDILEFYYNLLLDALELSKDSKESVLKFWLELIKCRGGFGVCINVLFDENLIVESEECNKIRFLVLEKAIICLVELCEIREIKLDTGKEETIFIAIEDSIVDEPIRESLLNEYDEYCEEIKKLDPEYEPMLIQS